LNRRAETRMLNAMRNLLAAGITDQHALVDTAAQIIGGTDEAKLQAQRVYDKHFKTYGAN